MLTFSTSFLLLQSLTKCAFTQGSSSRHQIVEMGEELNRRLEILPNRMAVKEPVILYHEGMRN